MQRNIFSLVHGQIQINQYVSGVSKLLIEIVFEMNKINEYDWVILRLCYVTTCYNY